MDDAQAKASALHSGVFVVSVAIDVAPHLGYPGF
jgi:hypothetical protein